MTYKRVYYEISGVVGFGDENLPYARVRAAEWEVELAFVFEGSGLVKIELGPDEARELAQRLVAGALKAEEEYKKWLEQQPKK